MIILAAGGHEKILTSLSVGCTSTRIYEIKGNMEQQEGKTCNHHSSWCSCVHLANPVRAHCACDQVEKVPQLEPKANSYMSMQTATTHPKGGGEGGGGYLEGFLHVSAWCLAIANSGTGSPCHTGSCPPTAIHGSRHEVLRDQKEK